MSWTLRGIRRVPPFRPSEDFDVFTPCVPVDLVATLSATPLATVLVFEAADFAAVFDFLAVDLAAVLALEVAFLAAEVDFFAAVLAVDFAVEVAFFAALDALSAAFAAALTFFATAALSPASWSFFVPAEATFETESIFADTNFFAVAAPTPGKAVNFSILEFPFAAMVSLNHP